MSGTIPLLPLYAFTAWTGRTLLFTSTKLLNFIKPRCVVSNLKVLDGKGDKCTLRGILRILWKERKHGAVTAVVKSHYQTHNVLSISVPIHCATI
jgi:hypothetical protein